MLRSALLFAAVLLVLPGCESDRSDLGVGDLEAPVFVRSYIAPDDRPQTPAARRALHEAGRAALMETREIFQTSASWTEADRRLRRLVDQQEDPLRRRRFEEAAAAQMLRLDVLRRSDSADALEATGHYAEVLVRHGSPDTPLLADAIGRLDGHWPADRVAEVASGALQAAEAYAARGQTCEDCRSGDTSAPTPPEIVAASTAQVTFDADVTEAVAQLRVLAGR